MTATTELRQQLQAAEAAEVRARAEQAKEQVRRLAAEGAALRAELEPLAAQIREAQNARLRCHGELARAREQIAALSQPLDPLGFPSEADEHQRQEALTAWRQRQQELLATHEDCIRRETVRPRAVQLQRRLETITFEIQNQTALAEGRKIGEVTGSVSQGVENFL
jgi:chromosome segregation ATPase